MHWAQLADFIPEYDDFAAAWLGVNSSQFSVSISHDIAIRSCIIILKYFLHYLLHVYNSWRYQSSDSTMAFHTLDHSRGINRLQFRQPVTLQLFKLSQTGPLFSILFNIQNSDSDWPETEHWTPISWWKNCKGQMHFKENSHIEESRNCSSNIWSTVNQNWKEAMFQKGINFILSQPD